jgi:hypothetical protein
MPWMLLVVATVSSIAAAVACYALRVRSLAVMIPMQVVFSFAVTYFVASQAARKNHEDDPAIMVMSALLALALPCVWLVLRAVFGPISGRRRIARGE